MLGCRCIGCMNAKGVEPETVHENAFWAVEILDVWSGKWWPTQSLSITKVWATVMNEEYQRKNPSGQFRVTKYVRKEQ